MGPDWAIGRRPQITITQIANHMVHALVATAALCVLGSDTLWVEARAGSCSVFLTIKVKQKQSCVQSASIVKSGDQSLGRINSKLGELDIEDKTIDLYIYEPGIVCFPEHHPGAWHQIRCSDSDHGDSYGQTT